MNDEPENIKNEEEAQRVAWLIAGYLRQTLSEKEHDELDEWVTASEDNQRLFEELTDPKNIEKGIAEMRSIGSEKMLRKIKEKVSFSETTKEKRSAWSGKLGIAASVILIAGMVTVYLMIFKKDKNEPVATEQKLIVPGGNKATLTLVNGKTINLEDAMNGLLDSTDGIDVLKSADGQLAYENAKYESTGEHVLTTPAGGQFSVRLPDGSRVWLNSSSTLKYPVVFGKDKRVVELTGEGYFEASPQPSPHGEGVKTPFIVKVGGIEVEVLGTEFNVNAYSDEEIMRTTLVEGKVRINSYGLILASQELIPGEQARVMANGEVKVESGVNINEIVAWKDGMFKFKDQPIEVVMRQVARWYDAEVVYEGKVDFHFNATIYRKEPLEKLLNILEETERVHFKIEGKRVYVRP